MRAMVLESQNTPLKMKELPNPTPRAREILIQVSACGVCRTDLHIVDGDLKEPKLPLIIGHEIVGRIVALGAGVSEFTVGQRVGVPWLGKTCGECRFCMSEQENLCDRPIFTGYQRDGGYAEYTIANARYCFALPDGYSDNELAPLLCAGLIGWRSFKIVDKMMANAKRLGFYGFGAAAHILTQIALHHGREIYAFTKVGDTETQAFARSLGAGWAGDSEQTPPQQLDAAIIFAPAGNLVVSALKAVRKGGVVVCGGIHMSDIPAFPYELLWGERTVTSVANLTREDAQEFLTIASRTRIKTKTQCYPLAKANEALSALRDGDVRGAAVLTIGE